MDRHQLISWLLGALLLLLPGGDAAGQSSSAGSPGTRNVTVITTLSAANTAVTLTLPAPATGFFHYITAITIVRTCTTAITGSTKLEVTTTNLPGSLAWSTGDACAIGSTNNDVILVFDTRPLKSSVAATATTIVAPAAGAAGYFRLTAYYFTAK